MRAVSLSNPQVISLLNRYYVPVYVSNEDYQQKGSALPDEKAALRVIFSEGYQAKMSVGTVHVYVLNPDGHLLESMHVAQASRAENLTAMLERSVQKLGTPAGEPIVKPASQSTPKVEADSLLLRLVARYLNRKGNDYTLVEATGGDWSALPSEDWIVLKPSQWAKLLPAHEPKIGDIWRIDRDIASTLLTHFYPPTENWDLSTNRFDRLSLKATALSQQGNRVRARLEGDLRMKHPFYHKDDDNFAQATVIGYMEFDAKKHRVLSLKMVTDQASYGGKNLMPYGVAVRSLPF
jgi:hypothetical protein